MIESTIVEIFFQTADKFANKPSLLYKKDGIYFPITYKELAEKVKIFASALEKFGVIKGEKVAILSENRPEWVVSDLGIMSIGAITVPLHITFSPTALINVLNHSEAKILIVSNSDLLHKVLLGQNDLKYLEKIIFIEDLTAIQKETLTNGKIFSWKSIFSRNNGDDCEKVFLDSEDVSSVIYTSGTTGMPKGVLLTHRNFLSNVEAINYAVPVKSSDVFLSFLPMSHVLERTAGYYVPLLFGATIAYAENIKQLASNLKQVRPTILISVPRVFEKFHDRIWDSINKGSPIQKKMFKWALKQKRGSLRYKIADLLVFSKIRQKMGGRLRLTISGGASLNEKTARFFLKIGILVIEGYGLTETSPVVSSNREKEFKFGTVGKPIFGAKVKISDDKEILVKGMGVFESYLKNEEETNKCFDEDGWFKTGDMGFIDKEGFLTVVGRKKEMIVTSGGKNVWPEPIENMLDDDRFVSQSMVIGNNRKFISALIVPDWEEVGKHFKENNIPLKEHEKLIVDQKLLQIFQKRLDEKINPNLSDYEKIKKFRLLPREFSQEKDELTPTLKLRRHIIERHFQKEIDEIFT
ncbi:MAG: long-chain fatty acid--CoA ligase [Candidatus Nealsonbacteria bacterium]|nr:long-chain fatty acid--CoA ligase [Candidatus Nealsonbacteria bacterium]